MKDPEFGVNISNKKILSKKYKNVFVGKKAISWMVNKYKIPKSKALAVGQTLLDFGLVSHCSSDKLPFTAACWYRFKEKERIKIPIVIINGFQGAELYCSKTKFKKWLTDETIDDIQNLSIELPIYWDPDTGQQRDTLKPGDLLKKTTMEDGYTIDPYNKLIKGISEKLGNGVYQFTYDWRRSLFEPIHALEELLETIREDHQHPAQVVAQDIGGLLTIAVMNKRPDLFSSVLFSGVPFKPNFSALISYQSGCKIIGDMMISPRITATFPSLLATLPTPEDLEIQINDPHEINLKAKSVVIGVNEELDMFKVQTWKDLQIGKYSQLYADEDIEDYDLFLETALNEAKEFKKQIQSEKYVEYPIIGIVKSISVKTTANIYYDDDTHHFDFSDLQNGDGKYLDYCTTPDGFPVYRTWKVPKRNERILESDIILDILEDLQKKYLE
eukprot:TRINITY_DN4407_c0_g1_i2.p1 TRINITY_DN4407_c0_g1~~TRINITY_DN4407_c0_g1_i2.p1  ORF type:complete len:443 (+),score=104.93 TRINITY_DN4407_c0_g1_i2:96-1424(+)